MASESASSLSIFTNLIMILVFCSLVISYKNLSHILVGLKYIHQKWMRSMNESQNNGEKRMPLTSPWRCVYCTVAVRNANNFKKSSYTLSLSKMPLTSPWRCVYCTVAVRNAIAALYRLKHNFKKSSYTLSLSKMI